MSGITFIFMTRFLMYVLAAYFSFKKKNYWVTALALTSIVLAIFVTYGNSRPASGVIANILAFLIVMVALNTRSKA